MSFGTIFKMIYCDLPFLWAWSLLFYSHKHLLILKLCQKVSYNFWNYAHKLFTYYSKKYARKIGSCLFVYNTLVLRHSWPPLCAPAMCAQRASLSVDHVLSCPKGGLPFLRNRKKMDLKVTLLMEVYSQVCVQPDHN